MYGTYFIFCTSRHTWFFVFLFLFLLFASLEEHSGNLFTTSGIQGFNFVVRFIISKWRTIPLFSRVTSGRVSPSDLPDSPSQTMPGSPRVEPPRHHHLTRHGKPLKPPLSAQPVKPVFEDGVRTFQVRPSFNGKCKWLPTFFIASFFLKLN